MNERFRPQKRITRTKVEQEQFQRDHKADFLYLTWVYNIKYALTHLGPYLKKKEEERRKKENG